MLADPGLVGAPDSVRLSAVVVAAKSNAATLDVVLTCRELGRWIGLTGQSVRTEVRPRLQRGLVVSEDVAAEPMPGAQRGRTIGVRWQVAALARARHEGRLDDPLRLTRPELATWWRVCEAVFGPGWRHADGSVTEPGLLGWRTGRSASTDRLALLRLVLRARADGAVRLCGGAVDRRGRAAATVARLLGCTSAGGEAVLRRLVADGVVALPTGPQGRLVIPVVAEAHARLRRAHRAAGRSGARSTGPAPRESSDAPVPEDQDVPQASLGPENQQVMAGDAASETVDLGSDAAVPLHADHTQMVTAGSEGTGVVSGFAGSAASGDCRHRGHAHAREDHATLATAVASVRPGAPEGPLRGEKRSQPSHNVDSPGARSRRAEVPPHLVPALAPVVSLWERLEDRPGARHVVIRAVQRAVGEVTRLVGPEGAAGIVADRLEQRLAEQGGPASVADPVGWLIGKGLPQRPGCHDPRCDDGVRLDTGGPCGECEYRRAGRREKRLSIAADVAAAMPRPRYTAEERRAEVEHRMREFTHEQLAMAARIRAQGTAARAQEEASRETAKERREAALAALEAARTELLARPCVDCGTPRSDGLCGACAAGRRTEDLVRQAAFVAAAAVPDAWDGMLATPAALDAARDAEDLLRRELTAAAEQARAQGLSPADVAVTVQLAAETALAERQAAALEVLAVDRMAVAAGRMAEELERRSGDFPGLSGHEINEAVAEAGAEARAAFAEETLTTRVRALAAARTNRAADTPAPLAARTEDQAVERPAAARRDVNGNPRHGAEQAGSVMQEPELASAPSAETTIRDADGGCAGWDGQPCGGPVSGEFGSLCGRCAARAYTPRTRRSLPSPRRRDKGRR
ncbi:hypothetical protein [Streptomyces sp. 8K308]|uniref:hypothetical protein n=1 Tax=Streptomyces sp. 8K308 TaxID=2530388 RepID=UPI00104AEFD3|nr:hypothetical protein [Streptomyces sp. 8K308]